jgi:hypothetical protein
LSKLTEEPLAATAIGEVDRKGIYFNYRTAVFVWCARPLFRFKREQKNYRHVPRQSSACAGAKKKLKRPPFSQHYSQDRTQGIGS